MLEEARDGPAHACKAAELEGGGELVAGHFEVAANLCQLAEVEGGDDVRVADEDVASHAAHLAKRQRGQVEHVLHLNAALNSAQASEIKLPDVHALEDDARHRRGVVPAGERGQQGVARQIRLFDCCGLKGEISGLAG